ncbi:MAG: hypothetical protein JJE48_01550 [Actinobacteria bacterium]|nr:hypothetical protein [Actinomycetota bacterium]
MKLGKEGKEETMSTEKMGAQNDSAKRYDSHRLLIGISAAILAVLVIASAFALGYFIGHGNGVTDTLAKGGRQGQVTTDRLNQGLGQSRGGGAAGERAREMIQSGEAELVRGDVTAVEEGKITVQTEKGNEAIALTDNTRYPGAGAQGKATGTPSGAAQLKNGQKVTVLVRRDSSGNMEALAVRVMGRGSGL